MLLVALSACAYSQTVPGTDPLRPVHDAVFSTLIPVEELKGDTALQARFAAVRENLWSTAAQTNGLRSLLLPFAHMSALRSQCGLSTYLGDAAPESFASLTRSQREHVFALLSTCEESEPRRLAMALREFYVENTYSAVQEQIAGVHLNLSADHKWIEQHRPKLRATRLRFDRERHEIISADGAIDYLIVGSGPAGSVLAHELRRGGKRVVLVERGSFVVPGSMQTRIIGGLLDARTSADGGIVIHNGMTVGGGSQVNVDLCFAPTSSSVQAHIEAWRREGRIGPEDFTRDQVTAAYDWVKQAIGTRRLPESEINANNRVLWEGAKKEGLHPKLYDLNTYPPGRSPYPVTDKRSAESELLVAALDDAANPLNMVPDADVRRVLFQDDAERKAVGVEIRMRQAGRGDGVIADPNGFGIAAGEVVTIHAKRVILSAGALGSPAILLRSGVPNDQIGRGVILHPSMPVIGRFHHTIDVLDGTQASVYVDDHLADRGYALESMSAAPVYAALMSPGSAMHTYDMVRSFRNLAGFGVMLIDSVSPSNRLVIDEAGEPRIEYRLADADKRRFREGVAQAVRVMFAAGAKQVYLPTTENVLATRVAAGGDGATLSQASQAELVGKNLEFVPNESILTSAHMQATDKMGTSAKDSVVGRDFHVWHTKNLYVVDGSVFPTSIGANPMQSIYTFAKIAADRMAAELR